MKPLTRLRLVALSGLVGVLAVAGPAALAQSAGGDDDQPFFSIRTVDSLDARDTTLGVTWTGDESALSDLTITADDEAVDLSAPSPITERKSVAIVVDSSAAMETALASVKDAVSAFASDLPEGTEMALVSYADAPSMVRDFTTDPTAIATGVDTLVPKGGAVMWDGIYAAAQALDDETGAQPNLVVISASPDSGSFTPSTRVTGLLTELGASVFAVGLGGSAPASSLEQLVSLAGGRYIGSDDASRTLRRDVVPSIVNQYEMSFATAAKDGEPVDLTAEIGDLKTSVSYVDGAVATGNLALAPPDVSSGGGGGLLHSDMAKLLAVILVLVGVSLGVYALVMVFTKDNDGLSAVLQVYSEGYGAEGDGDGDDTASGATTAFIQRAVDLTENIAERQGVLAKTEGALERAAMPLRAAEALFFYAAFLLVVVLALFFIVGNLMATLLVGGIVAAIPPVVVMTKAKKRQKAFLAQLPDTLALLAGTLRAGYSLMQGVEAVSQEVAEPMGSELRRVVTESRLGRPLEESLEASAERMNSPDFSWAVMAIRIQREVGGNLAELLLTVGDTMTQRERLRRDVAALTAEGKVSAMVLGFLPIGLGAAMFVINPEYISVLFTTKSGNVMLGFAVMLALFGFWWMKKTIEIEI